MKKEMIKMKDNYVILDEYCTPEGYYYIQINTHLGAFYGHTLPDKVDKDYPSEYHASEIALAKALRKFAQAAVQQLNREFEVISGMIKQACDIANGPEDIDNTAFRIMNGTLKQKRKEIEKWKARIESLSKNIQNRIAARDKIVANYIEKDKNK